jgi:hypothetical protein
MRWSKVPDHDSLFRHTIHPIAFKRKSFQWQKALKLYVADDGSLLASVVWERYVPTTEYIHAYGCRLALGINQSDRQRGKFKDSERKIYCGAYELKANKIRELSATEELPEVFSADVVHHIENGEIAHTDLRIVLRPNYESDLEGTKTAILDRLWNTCYGPLPHICDSDLESNPHPSSVLTVAPAGPYTDPRTRVARFWCTLRFRFYTWLWRNFSKSGKTLRT